MDKKFKLLVIEDERLVYEALRRKLDNTGFEVINAFDGKEGLELSLKEHPDLILLDIILPVMDGITYLESLRADEWGERVPVIILSNLSDADTIQESRLKGVNDYLVKTDWKLDEVIEKIKNILNK
jgi:DNA-binding response OmpR family regulator